MGVLVLGLLLLAGLLLFLLDGGLCDELFEGHVIALFLRAALCLIFVLAVFSSGVMVRIKITLE